MLRIDRIVTASTTPETFTPRPRLDALAVLEEHLSQGWAYDVDVVIDAARGRGGALAAARLGTLSPSDDGRRTRLRASTANPSWYAGRLAVLPYAFHVHGSAELRQATADLGRGCSRPGRRLPSLLTCWRWWRSEVPVRTLLTTSVMAAITGRDRSRGVRAPPGGR